MELTPHFDTGEFLVSDDYPQLAAQIKFGEWQRQNALFLCGTILEPCRMFVGYPFKITSGLRSCALNNAIGGAPDSQHLYGEAADFAIPHDYKLLKDAYEWIRSNCMYQTRKLIWYLDKNFIHIATYPVSSKKDTKPPKFLYAWQGKLYVQNPLKG